ncbi:PAS domain S-box protein [Paenibacillus tritici]|uniref:ATP-binding protein n=1 Tax=Paenibacillus tritici TaxID=1873425 RepID=UPI001BA474E5|nr:ATP-binding protein [Paenibacillus tritici]QUL52367.1 PAS domain S-box protein [Paenibacillus tritici]
MKYIRFKKGAGALEHPLNTYNDLLVLLSVAIAFLSCFTALDLTERLLRSQRGPRYILLISLVLGTGMWSMHFIGMRAMDMGVPVSYDLLLLAFSLIIPVAASYMLLVMLNNQRTRSRIYLGLGGLLFSSGILIMHFSGILSMKLTASYEQGAFSMILSVLFALIVPVITASYDPKWLEKDYNMFSFKKLLLVITLTGAFTGIHYAAMAGASFPMVEPSNATRRMLFLNDSVLGLLLAGSFLFIVSIVLALLYRDRQRVLQAAAFNEQRYTALFEHSPDMVMCIDPARKKIISVNPSLRNTTGYGTEELGNYKAILYSERDEAAVRDAVLRASRGQSSKLELKVRTKGGEQLICSVTVFPLQHHTEQLVYIVAEDVTTLMKFQYELMEARDAAESAVTMKSEFLATMSHEIRTPLNGIIGINQLLAEEISNPEHLELLQLQSTSGHALLKVMSDILDISRLEADSLALTKDDFQLKALLQGCMDLFMVSTQDKPLSLELEMEEGLPDNFAGDSQRLRQILINLIGNAVKFTPSGTITVKVESYGVRESAQSLQFMVRDTGIGISPDKLQLLFQTFSQVDGSHTRKYPGTGLGLAICKKLVDLMQGEIWVEPAEGGGTQFFFRIKLQSLEHSPELFFGKEKEDGGAQETTEAV